MIKVQDQDDQQIDDRLLPSPQQQNHPPKPASHNFYGDLFCLVSAVFSSLGTILTRTAHITSGPEQTLIRYLVQGSIMAVLILSNAKNTQITFLGPAGSRHLLMLRGACGTVAMLSLHMSIKLINPGDTVALVNLKTILVTVFARCLLNERISSGHLACLVSSVLGVVFISQPGFIFAKRPDANSGRVEADELEFLIGASLGNLFFVVISCFFFESLSDKIALVNRRCWQVCVCNP